MADSIDFYTNPMSRGQIVRWMLEETGAPYTDRIIDYPIAMKGADYLAINPMGKVPAIVHRGEIVTECAAICAYLADVFPDAGLAPRAEEKARYYRWLFFGAGPVEAAVADHAAGFVPNEQQQRMFGYGTYDRMVDVLEQAVSAGDHVAGPRFTAADVYVGSQVIWGVEFGTLPRRPAFEAYAARLTGRPAYRKAKAIDSALIAEMQQPA
jgi:glutathione S-transferase